MIEYLYRKLNAITNERARRTVRWLIDAIILVTFGSAVLSIYQAYAKMNSVSRTIEVMHDNNDKLRRENRLLEDEILTRLKKIEKQ